MHENYSRSFYNELEEDVIFKELLEEENEENRISDEENTETYAKIKESKIDCAHKKIKR